MFHVNQPRQLHGGVSRESFPDAEGSEQVVENGLGVHATKQAFESCRSAAQLFSSQFWSINVIFHAQERPDGSKQRVLSRSWLTSMSLARTNPAPDTA